MTAAIDYNAINAKAEQTRAMVDKAYQAADKVWQDALEAIAVLARMYGIDPAKVRIMNSNEGWGDIRLSVTGEFGYSKGLHEDEGVANKFIADANFIVDNSMFYGFFERDADVDDYNTISLA